MVAKQPATPLRIIELAQGTAGPALGRMLAALGHEVIKCEPPGGDWARTALPVDRQGRSFGFAARNAGKRSIALDLDDDSDRGILFELLPTADVLITDLDVERTRELGLDEITAKRTWPGLVVISITSFGSTSSQASWGDNSLLAEAAGGLANMVGEPGRKPLSLGGEQTAYATAYAALLGLAVALLGKRRDGQGEFVDLSLRDMAAFMDWKSDVIHASVGWVPRRLGVSGKRWRMVRAADGWVGVIYQPHQWPALVELVGSGLLSDPRLGAESFRSEHLQLWWPAIEAWALSLSKQEIYHRAQQLGLPFGYCADVRDLVESEQLTSRGFIFATHDAAIALTPVVGPLIHCEALSWQAGMPPALDADRQRILTELAALPKRSRRDNEAARVTAAPLEGYVVLDFGTITAGAAAARHLGDYGATVIKIESQNNVDPFRNWTLSTTAGALPGPTPPLFDSNNANKLGITLDLKDAADREVFRRIAARADVLIENFALGVTERLGVDYQTLHALNPQLIYLSLSSQGQAGPEARNRSYGSTLDLLSGLASVTGYDSDCPQWSSSDVNYPDQIVALFGAAAVAYCLAIDATGVHLDISQREVTAWTLADVIGAYIACGTIAAPSGNRRSGFTPHDTYPSRDSEKWLAISCRTDAQRRALADVIGRPDLARQNQQAWLAQADAIDAAISAWTGQQPLQDALRELHKAGVPSEPVADARDRAAAPELLQRKVRLLQPVPMKGYPFRLAGYAPPPPTRAPKVGEHSARIRRAVAEGTTLNVQSVDSPLLAMPA